MAPGTKSKGTIRLRIYIKKAPKESINSLSAFVAQGPIWNCQNGMAGKCSPCVPRSVPLNKEA